jgi:hypothetical protein
MSINIGIYIEYVVVQKKYYRRCDAGIFVRYHVDDTSGNYTPADPQVYSVLYGADMCSIIALDLDVIRYSPIFAIFGIHIKNFIEKETKEELFFILFISQQQLPIVFVYPQQFFFFSAPIISSAALSRRPLLMEKAIL